jgi:hypothetical protein
MGSRLVLSYPIVRFRLWYYGLFRQLQSLFAGQKSASRKFHRIALRKGFEQLDGLVMLKRTGKYPDRSEEGFGPHNDCRSPQIVVKPLENASMRPMRAGSR